jgi:hypothetical protein
MDLEVTNWCRTNAYDPVGMYHRSWYSNLYAEPYGDLNHIAPVPGYNATGGANWHAAYEGLIDIAFANTGTDLTMEFASSGTINSNLGGIAPVLNYGASLFENKRDARYFIQENGIGLSAVAPYKYHGLGSTLCSRGGQMYAGGDFTSTEWTNIKNEWCVKDQLTYLEVYTNSGTAGSGTGSKSFEDSGSATLKSVMEAWSATVTG